MSLRTSGSWQIVLARSISEGCWRERVWGFLREIFLRILAVRT